MAKSEGFKFLKALALNKKMNDNTPVEQLEVDRAFNTLDKMCQDYLTSDSEILEVEVAPKELQAVIAALEIPRFQERYQYAQVSESMFQIQLKGLDLYD